MERVVKVMLKSEYLRYIEMRNMNKLQATPSWRANQGDACKRSRNLRRTRRQQGSLSISHVLDDLSDEVRHSPCVRGKNVVCLFQHQQNIGSEV